MARIVHFEIPADNPEKVMKFFTDVFDWQFQPYGEDYWFAITGPDDPPGINGGVMKKKDPRQPLANTMDVASVDDTVKKIEAAGGTVVVPKMTVGDMGYVAYFMDPEGTIHGIWESIPQS
jgi:predicted enzyme related to lactoylglutathione lyase